MTIYEGLPRAVPEDVGMSTSRLECITPVMQGWVDNGKIPCALTMIAREGRLVHLEKFGTQDVASAKPVGFDTIFRIYSMTKPITSIAVMMLYEEGHFQLGTPVSELIPAFKDMQVYTEGGAEIVDAEREMTVKHLLTHTSGLIYGGDWDHPINQRYRRSEFLRRRSRKYGTGTRKCPALLPPRWWVELRHVYRRTRLSRRSRIRYVI